MQFIIKLIWGGAIYSAPVKLQKPPELVGASYDVSISREDLVDAT